MSSLQKGKYVSYDPYDTLPEAQAFDVTSESFRNGDTLPIGQVGAMLGTGGGDRTPHLRWFGAPAETKSFALTCFDPDAPTVSGFWHLAAFNISADRLELPEGALHLDERSVAFPEEASILRNDGGVRGFIGAAPPAGHGPHRYMFVVHALTVEHLDLDPMASPGLLGFQLFGATIGRARITGTYEVPELTH